MAAPVSDSISSVLSHPWNPAGTGAVDAATLESWVEEGLLRHRKAIEGLLAVEGSRILENTLRVYDNAVAELGAVGSLTGLMHSVYPDKPVRDTAQALLQKISQAGVELSLNRDVYQALAKIDASGADAATKHYLDRTLLQYRLAGVDKDDATRAKIKELQDQATLTSLNFGRNVQEGGNTVMVNDAAELDGLPADFLEAHAPGEDGKITLTTDFPDYLPVMTFARSGGLRRIQHPGVPGESAAVARPVAHSSGDGDDSGLRALGRSGDRRSDDGVGRKHAGVSRRSGSCDEGWGGEGIRDDPGVCAHARTGIEPD
jgi:Zn-dependent oligopeptidase